MSGQLGSVNSLLLIILIAVVVVLILMVIIFSRSIVRMQKKYNRFMRGLDGVSLEKEFANEFSKMDDYRTSQQQLSDHIQEVEKYQKSSFSKYGVVKYDAFEDVGGKLSFALALLDERDTGFVINAIHSKDNCFLYLKEIVNGESYIMLSNEEVSALTSARNFRKDEFEEREDKTKNIQIMIDGLLNRGVAENGAENAEDANVDNDGMNYSDNVDNESINNDSDGYDYVGEFTTEEK